MGAINVKHTGSGADIALSSDGTSLLLDGTAIGGGGADLYAANESSPQAQPSATGTNAVAIGDDAVASGEHSFAAMLDSEASGTQSIAIGRNALSSGSLATAIGYAATSAGSQSVALGQAYASGTDSFAAAIDNNTSSYGATGNNSIAGGYLNKATGSDSIAWGGDSNVTANSQATVVGGWLNVNYGGYSTIVGGRGNVIYGSYSRAGGFNSYTGDNVGKDVWATDDFSTAGDSQTAKRVLMAATTDATATVLTTQRVLPMPTTKFLYLTTAHKLSQGLSLPVKVQLMDQTMLLGKSKVHCFVMQTLHRLSWATALSTNCLPQLEHLHGRLPSPLTPQTVA
jgi:hypothetical protein